ncbi:hypothetical protein GHT07_10835 [Caenimonas koreensis DSM 17982]|uniref:Uncharacterized protein n=2 Tax=Caenimonas TaxID=763439 RepID=A0A844AUJ1_9BURK|nr:hypothetical protein [Caenimonas koreensis DSM 17982]
MTRALCAMAIAAAMPGLALAQAAPAKPAAKPAATKPAAKTPAKPKLAPSAQKAVEEMTPIDDDPTVTLTEADLEVAKKIFVGDIPCELGATVKIAPMKREGLFLVSTKGYRFAMHPVESRTGAIRLEDPKRGAMWLQLGNKSMLMSQKLGQRLADECQSPAQVTFAEEMKKKPAVNLLESTPAGPSTTATSKPSGPN